MPDFLGRDKKQKQREDLAWRKQMQNVGIHVIGSEWVKIRIGIMKDVSDKTHRSLVGESPVARLHDLLKKIEEVDVLVRRLSMVWIRAGTDQVFRRAIRGYESILQRVTRDIKVGISDIEGKDPVAQMNIAFYQELWANMLYFYFARYITSVSFFDKDVSLTEQQVAVVQTQMPFGISKRSPDAKEDDVGKEMWTEYMRQNEQRLRKIEARQKKGAKSEEEA